MLLIFNTIIDDKARQYFSNVIAGRISFGKDFRLITLNDPAPDLHEFSHLLITGSELSASAGSKWDEKIISVIAAFLKADKVILGICHGHQMVARTIAGDAVCRRCKQPEFGWKHLKIAKNRLFDNISQPIFLEAHYDEVVNLDDRFEIIAANDLLPVQAFQLKNRPVWGVQFHPEMLWEDGNRMIEKHLQQHPDDRKFFAAEMENEALIPDNLNLLRNFLAVGQA